MEVIETGKQPSLWRYKKALMGLYSKGRILTFPRNRLV